MVAATRAMSGSMAATGRNWMTVWDTGTPGCLSVIVWIEQVLDTMVKVDRAYDMVGPAPG
ncbi:hypothetical protein GCM10009570_31350 [Dietzia natronolimnaea]